MNNEKKPLLIVTGLSGAGKTKTIKILEDLGYFCVDNLPVAMLSGFAQLTQDQQKIKRMSAVVIDIREGEQFLDNLWKALDELDHKQIPYSILFMEASDAILVRRFSESRRTHPLSDEGSILMSIQKEKNYFMTLKNRADYLIDTTDLSVKDLRDQVIRIISRISQLEMNVPLTIKIISFGYKSGIPIDADIVMDVRFLPNPFYDEALRPLTGLSDQISKYVADNPLAKQFIQCFTNLLDLILPLIQKEGKDQITIAFGCTGGKHRSVAIAKMFSFLMQEKGYMVRVFHRDIDKDDNMVEWI